jgi:capsular exopolysaccharide synthesis family protein
MDTFSEASVRGGREFLRPETAVPVEQPDEHLVSLLAPRSYEAEQYRVLRHLIEQMHKESELRVIAVTSPAVGDGKTTTSINLAGALAQDAKTRVLLIDADLRRGSVEEKFRFRKPSTLGLAEAIADPSLALTEVVRSLAQFNLALVPAGQSPAAPYEAFKSPRFTALLREAREAYDYVVVDTPPLIPVPDSRVIAKCVDGFLLIVAAHRTPQRLIEEALDIIEPAKMIGIVFNRDDRPISNSYGYYGGYGEPLNGHHAPWWRARRKGRE